MAPTYVKGISLCAVVQVNISSLIYGQMSSQSGNKSGGVGAAKKFRETITDDFKDPSSQNLQKLASDKLQASQVIQRLLYQIIIIL